MPITEYPTFAIVSIHVMFMTARPVRMAVDQARVMYLRSNAATASSLTSMIALSL